ncbi:S-adenosyl-L-methionine-dependent methyltransferase [Mrakia frigida]|uniref:S-adenosyl-L-methionine-dependent methyltransferase n=1 Tax=Mrakia frigida TaxID=29902 RepID=UPI003FCC2457
MTSFQAIIAEHASEGWEKLWKATTTPWDKGFANPPLVALLEKVPQEVKMPEKGQAGIRTLVAGCGRGYDVEAFSRLGGWDSWGLDLSETAIEEAKSWYSSLPTPSTPIGPVSFHALDFFTFDLPSGAFNLAFDNTFLCALPPSLRSAWGTRYAALLPSPGSLLITRAYPLMDAAEMAKGTGPPWGLNMEIYQTLLPEESWKKVWDGEGGEKGRLVVWERV